MSDEETTLSTSEMFNLILEHVRSIDTRMNSMDVRFNAVEEDNRFIKQGIINLGIRVDSIEQRLEVVESVVKEDSLNTQPKLDDMQAEIAEVRAETKARFDAMQTEARDTNRRLRGLTKYLLDLIAEHEKLEDRLEELEHHPS
ncbi:MAG: hypothetical protein L0229_30995 [Blastocatellia bacterium]|nr:hypothetical protein [Blastocatellia bacterium]